jgi:glycosyltransferase involved in cell wall biosynthesis
MQEVCGENAIYADVTDPASLAARLMHIYKDEDLRHRLGRSGVELARRFHWDKAAAAYWQCILDAAGANP